MPEVKRTSSPRRPGGGLEVSFFESCLQNKICKHMFYILYSICSGLLNFTPRSTHLFGRTVNDGLLDASACSLLRPAAKAPRDRIYIYICMQL